MVVMKKVILIILFLMSRIFEIDDGIAIENEKIR